MKEVTTSTSIAAEPVRPGMDSLGPKRLSRFAAWLFRINAERWRERALFYERHRDYFPRLASRRFVDRCRELEETYRGLAQVLFNMPSRLQLVPVRAVVSRIK